MVPLGEFEASSKRNGGFAPRGNWLRERKKREIVDDDCCLMGRRRSAPPMKKLRQRSDSALSRFQPPSHDQNNDPFQERQLQRRQFPITTSRRGLTMISFLAAMPSLFLPAPAAALNLGISGTKDCLKEQ
ncbi:hypothetical protein SDJN03_18332, partial [Cucurbita argyrosperma subsp. sororia]